MQISWGKPKIEIAEISNGTPGSWTQVDNPVEGSTVLETTEGETTEAYAEGHELIDSKKSASKYVLSFELYNRAGHHSKPISDTDGVITSNYAVRLTPEDSSLPGFILNKCAVGCTDSWSAADGEKWKYSFTALKPDSGAMKESYSGGA